MQKNRQRLGKLIAAGLLVGLMIPGLALAAVSFPDPHVTDNRSAFSPALLAHSRPAEAEHENGLMFLLARMLDDRLANARQRARQRAREAAYERWLKRQINWRADWDGIAMCESTQRWHLDVGIFDGGLQFHPLTWINYGGRQFATYAWQASKLEQMVVASRVLASEGPMAWPHCFRWS
jgi:hypothetical protein